MAQLLFQGLAEDAPVGLEFLLHPRLPAFALDNGSLQTEMLGSSETTREIFY